MSIVAVDEIALQEPNLLVPFKQPIGCVKAVSPVVGARLIHCALAPSTYDYGTRRFITAVGGALPDPVSYEHGRAYEIATAGPYLPFTFPETTLTEWTLVVIFKRYLTSTAYFLGIRSGGSGELKLRYDAANINGTIYTFARAVTSTFYEAIVITGNNNDLTVKTALFSPQTGLSITEFSVTEATQTNVDNVTWFRDLSTARQGCIAFSALLDKSVPLSTAVDLAKDPYQFLIPA